MTLQAGYPGQQTMQFRRVKIITVNEEATEVVVRDGTGWQTKLDGTLRPKGMGLPEENEIWLIESIGPMWLLRAQEKAGGIDLGPDVNALIAEEVARRLAEEALADAERRAQEAALAAGIMGGDAVILIQETAPDAEHENTNTLWIDTSFGRSRPMRWSVEDSQWIVVIDQIAIEAARMAVEAHNAAQAADAAAQAAEAAAEAAQGAANEALNKAEDALGAALGKGRVIYGHPDTTPGEVNSLLIGPGNRLYIWAMVNPPEPEPGEWVPVPDDQLAALQHLIDAHDAILDAQMTVLSSVLGDLSGVQGKADGQVTIWPTGSNPDLGPEDLGDLRLLVDNKVEYWDGTQWVPADAAVTQAVLEAAEALDLANQKSTTYFKETAPTTEDIEPPTTEFSTNDFWVRSGDNRLHRWDGNNWIDIHDRQLDTLGHDIGQLVLDLTGVPGRADGQQTIYVQDTAPTDVGGIEDTGDIWIDTFGGNRVYKVWNGEEWVPADARIAEMLADLSTKITTYYSEHAPTLLTHPLVTGDIWLRIPDNRMHRWSGIAWDEMLDAAIGQVASDLQDFQNDLTGPGGLLDGKTTVYFQTANPNTPAGTLQADDQGDIWINPNSGVMQSWDGTKWVPITDPEAIKALEWITGKITTYYKDTPPVAGDIEPPETQFREGDLWFRTTDSKLHRRTGAQWQPLDLATGKEVEEDIEDAVNLVNNVTRTGNTRRWSPVGAVTRHEVVTLDFNGVNISVLESTSSVNRQIHSDPFPVDVTKAYEFRIWLRDTVSQGAYFGLHTLDANGTTVTAIAVDSGGAPLAPSNNIYFWQGTQGPDTWVEYVAYLLPLGTDPQDAVDLGKNILRNVIFDNPSTSQARMRFLNWGHNSTSPDRTMYAAHMVVTETTMEAIKQAAIGRREAAAALSASDDIRDNIIPSVQEEVVTAGGRFTGATRAPLPADGVGKPVNAIWNAYDGNNLLGSWIWQTNPFTTEMQWMPRAPQTVHIDDGTYGELSGLRLTANSISVRHLLVSGNGPNMIIDPGYVDAVLFANRLARSQGTWTLVTTTGGPPRVRTTARSTANVFYMGGDSGSASRYMKIEANQTYRIKYQARAGTNLGNATRPAIRYRNSAGNLVYTGGGDFTAIGTAWKWLTFQWSAPNGATEAEFDIQAEAGNSSWSEYADYSVTPMIDGTMIVEGAIKTISTGNPDNGITIRPDGSSFSNGVIEFNSPQGYSSISLESHLSDHSLVIRGISGSSASPNIRLTSTPTFGSGITIDGVDGVSLHGGDVVIEPTGSGLSLGVFEVMGDSILGSNSTSVTKVTGNLEVTNRVSLGISGSQIDIAGSRVSGAWFSYVPTLTSNGTNPSGAITRFGRWQRIGRTVHFSIMITMGSTFNAGSGYYALSLPVAAATNRTQIVAGQIRIGTDETMIFGKLEGGSLIERMWTATGQAVHSNRNFGNGDRITLTGTYEAATN